MKLEILLGISISNHFNALGKDEANSKGNTGLGVRRLSLYHFIAVPPWIAA